jgi:hypothetical protein
VLNLVLELKFLDVLMGREDPIEFDIWAMSFLLFVWSVGVVSLFCWGDGRELFKPLLFVIIFMYIYLIHLF